MKRIGYRKARRLVSDGWVLGRVWVTPALYFDDQEEYYEYFLERDGQRAYLSEYAQELLRKNMEVAIEE